MYFQQTLWFSVQYLAVLESLENISLAFLSLGTTRLYKILDNERRKALPSLKKSFIF